MYYSATTNGFYPSELKDDYMTAGTWPDDGVEISESVYQALMDGQDSGQEIIPGEDGMPELFTPAVDHVSQTGTQRAALLKEADNIIRMLERAVRSGIATDEEKASLEAWEEYSVLLYRINPDKYPDIDWPQKPE